jgi:hypothetical protein
MNADVTIVVRSANERTEDLCATLARPQGSSLEVIHERPFHRALVRGFEIGLAARRAWTLCLDADILLFPDAVSRLKATATDAPDSSGCGGTMIDKFYGDLRVRGAHLYRTDLLSREIEIAREMGDAQRPETRVHDAMTSDGHPWLVSESAVGLHGYGQFYRDIFRTNAVRVMKSSVDDVQLRRRTQLWQRFDVDFRVMNEALQVGANDHRSYSLDRDHWQIHVEKLFQRMSIAEKGSPSAIENELVRRTVDLLGRVPPSALKRLLKRKLWAQRQLSSLLS